jgi:hypothetical protein
VQAPENIVLELEIKTKVDEAMSQALATLKKFDTSIREVAREINKTNKEFANTNDVEAYKLKMSALTGQLSKTSRTVGDAEVSMEAWRNELVRQQAIMTTLPNKIKEVTISIDRLKASGQTSGPVWQTLHMEMAKLIDMQRKLDAASAGSVESMKKVRYGVQNASYQVTDFFVSVQSGTSAMRAFAQQAPQFLSAFGFWGVIAGLAVSVGTAILSIGQESSKAKDEVDKLSTSTDILQSVIKDAPKKIDDVAKAYNSMGKEARETAIKTTELAAAMAMKEVMENTKLLRESIDKSITWKDTVARLARDMNSMDKNVSPWIADEFNAANEWAVEAQQQVSRVRKEFGLLSNEQALYVMGPMQDYHNGLINEQQLYDKLFKTFSVTPQGVTFLDGMRTKTEKVTESLNEAKRSQELLLAMLKAGAGGSIPVPGKKETIEANDIAKEYAESIAKLIFAAQKATEPHKEISKTLQEELDAFAALDPQVKVFIQGLIDQRVAIEQNEAAHKQYLEDMKAWQEQLKDWETQAKLTAKADDEAAQVVIDRGKAEVASLEELAKARSTLFEKALSGSDKYILDLAEYKMSISEIIEEYRLLGQELTEIEAKQIATFRKIEPVLNTWQNLAKSIGGEVANSMGSAVDDMIESFGKAKFSFSDFAQSMLKDLAKMMSQMLIFKPLAQSIMGFDWMSIFKSANGNPFLTGTTLSQGVYNSPTLFKFANGGVLGRTGVLAEAGRPEAVVPLVRYGKDLGVKSSPVVINVHNNAQAEVSVQESQGPDGMTMLNVFIERRVKEIIGSGRMDRQMFTQYGLARQPG